MMSISRTLFAIKNMDSGNGSLELIVEQLNNALFKHHVERIISVKLVDRCRHELCPNAIIEHGISIY